MQRKPARRKGETSVKTISGRMGAALKSTILDLAHLLHQLLALLPGRPVRELLADLVVPVEHLARVGDGNLDILQEGNASVSCVGLHCPCWTGCEVHLGDRLFVL